MMDALTAEMLERVQTAVSGLDPATKAAALRQLLAVASAQLCSLEGTEHVELVQGNILRALRRAA